MIFNKVFILLALVGLTFCADNTTSTNTTTTPTTSQNTTTTTPTTTTINTTQPLPVTTTTTPTPSTSSTTSVTTTTKDTTTTEAKTTTKIINCDDPACLPYSVCGKGNVCLMECPNMTKPTNSSVAVCGSDGVTYASIEELEMNSCTANKKVTKDHDGECKEKTNKKYVIIVVVLVMVLVVVIGVAAYWICSKRNAKSKDLKRGEKSGDNLL